MDVSSLGLCAYCAVIFEGHIGWKVRLAAWEGSLISDKHPQQWGDGVTEQKTYFAGRFSA